MDDGDDFGNFGQKKKSGRSLFGLFKGGAAKAQPDALKYKAKTTADVMGTSPKKAAQRMFLEACPIWLFRFVNNQNKAEGQAGCAVVPVAKQKMFVLHIYKPKDRAEICQAFITPDFGMLVQKDSYLSFYDKNRQYWTMCPQGQATQCEKLLHAITLARCQDPKAEFKVIKQDLLPYDTTKKKLTAGDQVKLRYTLWSLASDHPWEKGAVIVQDRAARFRLGSGKDLAGIEQVVEGAVKGQKFLAVLPGSLVKATQHPLDFNFPSGKAVLAQIEVRDVRFKEDEPAAPAVVAAAPAAQPVIVQQAAPVVAQPAPAQPQPTLANQEVVYSNDPDSPQERRGRKLSVGERMARLAKAAGSGGMGMVAQMLTAKPINPAHTPEPQPGPAQPHEPQPAQVEAHYQTHPQAVAVANPHQAVVVAQPQTQAAPLTGQPQFAQPQIVPPQTVQPQMAQPQVFTPQTGQPQMALQQPQIVRPADTQQLPTGAGYGHMPRATHAQQPQASTDPNRAQHFTTHPHMPPLQQQAYNDARPSTATVDRAAPMSDRGSRLDPRVPRYVGPERDEFDDNVDVRSQYSYRDERDPHWDDRLSERDYHRERDHRGAERDYRGPRYRDRGRYRDRDRDRPSPVVHPSPHAENQRYGAQEDVARNVSDIKDRVDSIFNAKVDDKLDMESIVKTLYALVSSREECKSAKETATESEKRHREDLETLRTKHTRLLERNNELMEKQVNAGMKQNEQFAEEKQAKAKLEAELAVSSRQLKEKEADSEKLASELEAKKNELTAASAEKDSLEAKITELNEQLEKAKLAVFKGEEGNQASAQELAEARKREQELNAELEKARKELETKDLGQNSELMKAAEELQKCKVEKAATEAKMKEEMKQFKKEMKKNFAAQIEKNTKQAGVDMANRVFDFVFQQLSSNLGQEKYFKSVKKILKAVGKSVLQNPEGFDK